ncbi:Alpha/Beta hydrolase protein [Phycomyces blakesleeanus]|uniref:Alpha/Beta hydrolase protein n=1 Tax=Phycomyces blakesleeanus TaxID=4837 RepID=A0ABR3BAA2_PHYBL
MWSEIVRNHAASGFRWLAGVIPYSIRVPLIQCFLSLDIPYVRAFMIFIGTPQGEQVKWVTPIKKDTWEGRWIFPSAKQMSKTGSVETSAFDADLIILYMHGGGFYFGTSVGYIKTFIEFINQFKANRGINARILSVEYSLSPEVQWPKQKEECLAAYIYLVHDLGISPSKIIIIGDSAGGNLVLQTTWSLCNQRTIPALAALPPIPMPAGVVPMSPWVDVELDEPALEAAKYTDILSKKIFYLAATSYLPQLKKMTPSEYSAYIKNPEISPIYGDYYGSCPMLLVYADKEMLAGSIIKFSEKMRSQGVPLTPLIRPSVAHIHIMESLCAPSEDIWREDIGVVVDWCSTVLKRK